MSEEGIRIWHYGLVAEWWAEFNRGGDDIQVFLDALADVSGPILDLGCGTGRLLVEFLKAGKDAHGCDASADMIAWCHRVLSEQDLSCPLYTQTVHELGIEEKFAAVYMCGAFGLGGSRTEDLKGLRRIHEHLRPGGTFLMDHYLPNLESRKGWSAWIEKPDRMPRKWPEHGDQKTALDGSQFELKSRQYAFDPLQQTTTLEIHVTKSKEGKVIAEERGLIDIGLYFMKEIELMLEVAGFSRIEVSAFGTDAPPEPWRDTRILFRAIA